MKDTAQDLSARLLGMELLLRALYVNWAEENDDPRVFNEQLIDIIIQSLFEVKVPSDEYEREVLQRTEGFLDRFQKAVDVRLRDLESEK